MPDSDTNAGATEVIEATSESTAETTQDTQAETGTTVDTSSGGSQEDSFFDPNLLPDDPEIQKAYKQLQGSYTRKMQQLSANQKKVDAYNAFEANPRQTLEQLAGQYGLSLQQAQEAVNQEFEPQDWNDVTKHVTDAVLKQLNPIMSEVRTVKQNSLEQMLDSSVPEWRDHEDDMKGLLAKHPTLADDPVTLARMAIPEDVQQGKAMQAALRKLEGKAKAANVSKGSGTSKAADPLAIPQKGSFQDYVEYARKKLAAESSS